MKQLLFALAIMTELGHGISYLNLSVAFKH